MMLEYWHNAEATRDKYAGDWLITGDLGVCDEEGYFWFQGRADDVITSGGYRVGPAEIEDALVRHPAVVMAAAIGVPDAAAYRVHQGLCHRERWISGRAAARRGIRSFVREHLAKHEVPREIEFVEALPMTNTGKIDAASCATPSAPNLPAVKRVDTRQPEQCRGHIGHWIAGAGLGVQYWLPVLLISLAAALYLRAGVAALAQHTQRMSRKSGNRFSEEDMRNQKILGCRFIGGFMSKLTLIKNGTIITVDPAISDLAKGDLLIEDGRIAQVAPQIDAGADAEVIDASDRLVLPGMVDTHRHTWQALFRNIGSDWTLAHYLSGLHGTVSGLYRAEDTYAGNLLGGLEALDSGITTLVDWCHNLNSPEHTDAAVDAHFTSGGRVVFGHGGGHRHWQPPSDLDHPADDVRRLRKGRLASDDQLVTLFLAPRGNQFATMRVTENDWALAAELGIRITCHFGDGEWGKNRPVAALAQKKLLGPTMTFVHCNSLADDELKMMADAGVTASVSPDIELQMGHGWPATGRLMKAGIKPSFSIDVCSSNGGHMFGTMRAAIGTQRGFDNEDARNAGKASVDEMELTCRQVLEFATIEGARACGMDGKIGSLTPGKRADIILVRTDTWSMTPLNNPIGQFVYNAHPGLVDTILVDGKVVKRDGKLLTADFARVRRLANDARDDIVRRAAGKNGLQLGGEWIPQPYPSAE